MSLKRALQILVVLVLAVGTIPAWVVANGRLERALRGQVTESLAMTPDLLANRWDATVDVRRMHARDVARTPGLAQALTEEDSSGAARIVEQAGAAFPEAPVLIGRDGGHLIPSDSVPSELVDATRRGGEEPGGPNPGNGADHPLAQDERVRDRGGREPVTGLGRPGSRGSHPSARIPFSRSAYAVPASSSLTSSISPGP